MGPNIPSELQSNLRAFWSTQPNKDDNANNGDYEPSDTLSLEEGSNNETDNLLQKFFYSAM